VKTVLKYIPCTFSESTRQIISTMVACAGAESRFEVLEQKKDIQMLNLVYPAERGRV
jgi:hypothetical protein